MLHRISADVQIVGAVRGGLPVIIDQRVTIAAPAEKAWDFLMDVPAVSRCVPGTEAVTQIDPDNYEGVLKVKVGPIALRLEGKISVVERNRQAWQARMNVQAADKRVSGAVNGKMRLNLHPRDDSQTDLTIQTDVAILGRLGEFGHAVIRKKADQMMAEFATNLTREVGAAPVEAA
jgi:carbon monoxide dehydrogenase subunit G